MTTLCVQLALPEGIAEQIQQQRDLNPRDRGTRGWQSRTYTDQPFAWFETVYRAVEAEQGPIDSWWFNVNTPGEYTGWHAHDRWTRVGVLYVQVPAGLIEFRQGGAYWTESPQQGDLLVFPGSLEHRVLPNTSEQVRISIAFNFKKR
jgi:quercetin dioxygenase-like cupin family protein